MTDNPKTVAEVQQNLSTFAQASRDATRLHAETLHSMDNAIKQLQTGLHYLRNQLTKQQRDDVTALEKRLAAYHD